MKTFLIIGDRNSLIRFSQFKAKHIGAMEQNLGNCHLALRGANVKILKENADSVKKSHKCNQCEYASSRTGDLRRHLKTHSDAVIHFAKYTK